MLKTNRITLSGIVIPADWGQDGRISVVCVAGYDEQVYIVMNNRMGRRLWSFLQKRVVVEGLVKRLDDLKMIQVIRIRMDTSNPIHPPAKHIAS